ncbi:uncharacterized protein MONBRDRAFT_37922 [Monosiga brevicollis MX1]|uniref:Uncharacterized protein n=1 Tax=Monosiga brevicollis TaxID=81824 RepID=A9V4M4_MONBE|nr:uncharacterized protein MONBRDRAFT_37922 [Monosiga brevicollis MX1]EDQ87479.1 predicted protein [Monosiga brevicollis MX1]|eukprot:XP_001747739.1 hypothetical protein [Monosiga brevicollis MX1]
MMGLGPMLGQVLLVGLIIVVQLVLPGSSQARVPGLRVDLDGHLHIGDGGDAAAGQKVFLTGVDVLAELDTLRAAVAEQAATVDSNTAQLIGLQRAWVNRISLGLNITTAASPQTQWGRALAVHNNLLFVGAPQATGQDNSVGMVYVLQHFAETDQYSSFLKVFPNLDHQHDADDDDADDDDVYFTDWQFGCALAVNDTTLFVGAFKEPSVALNAGAVLIYSWSTTNKAYEYANRLLFPGSQTGDWFGRALALQDNELFVGASGDDSDGVNDAGAVYLYQRSSADNLILIDTIFAPDKTAGANFGTAVGISGADLAVGAPNATHDRFVMGAVYIMTRTTTDGSYTMRTKLLPNMLPGASVGMQFGQSLAFSGDLLAVGAPLTDVRGPNSGSIYLFYRDTAQVFQLERVIHGLAGAGYGLALDPGLALFVTQRDLAVVRRMA